jgi:hypothetical protein
MNKEDVKQKEKDKGESDNDGGENVAESGR